MKHITKTLSLFLALLMLVSVFASVGLTAFAAESITSVSNWSELKTALENGQNGTVMLSKSFNASITTNDRVIISGGSKTLDFNLKDFDVTANGDLAFCNLFTVTGGSLTVTGFATLKYTYNISSEYADTRKPSAICYVNGGTLKVNNCGLRSITGPCVKVNKGTATLGTGAYCLSQANWAVTDDPTGTGTVIFKNSAYATTHGQSGMNSQGAHSGYGALGLFSENTKLSVLYEAEFGGGVQLKTAEQAKQFSCSVNDIYVGDNQINYEMKTDFQDAVDANQKCFWYTYGGTLYYFQKLNSNNEFITPTTIYVSNNKSSYHKITATNTEGVYAYNKGGLKAVSAAEEGDNVLIQAMSPSDDTLFDKWVVTSGTAQIRDPEKIKTHLIMGSTDVSINATYINNLNRIRTVTINNITAPVAGATMSYDYSLLLGVDYRVAKYSYGTEIVEWWQNNSLAEGKFEAGKEYEIRIMLEPKDPENMPFAQNVNASVNGNVAHSELKGDKLLVTYTFPATSGGQTQPTTSAPQPQSDFKYTTSGTKATITSYSGSAQVLAIPSVIDGYTVTAIGDDAFFDNDDLRSVSVPDTVTYIGNNAFSDCSSLTHITLPDSVTAFGCSVFECCDTLEEITLPKHITAIPENMFDDCPLLTDVSIPSGVTSIGEFAFYDCDSLKNIDIPATVTSFGNKALGYMNDGSGTVKVNGFTINGYAGSAAQTYAAENGFNFKELAVTPESEYEYEILGDSAVIKKYIGSGGKVEIPYELDGKEVTAIASGAFANDVSVTSVSIHDFVETIGDGAFFGCENLTHVTMGSNVELLGEDAFFGTALYNDDNNWTDGCLYIDSALIKVLPSAATTLDIDFGTRTIAAAAAMDCSNLTELNLPDTVVYIGGRAFLNCENIKSIEISNAVQSIGDHAFGFIYDSVGDAYLKVEGFRIYAEKGGIADQYADQYGFNYQDKEMIKKIILTYEEPIVGNIPCTEAKLTTEPKGGLEVSKVPIQYWLENTSTHIYDAAIFNPNLPFNAKRYFMPVILEFYNGGYKDYIKDGYGVDANTQLIVNGRRIYNDYDMFTLTGVYAKSFKITGIKDKAYTGKAITQSPTVTVDGVKLKLGTHYKLKYSNNKNVGTASVTIEGIGFYNGTVRKTFKITKAKNPMTVTAKKTVTANSNKNTTIKAAVTVKKAQGKVTYKTNNKKVAYKNGKLIVQKGLKKGKTYTVKITVTAKGNKNYNKLSKTVNVKIKVK